MANTMIECSVRDRLGCRLRYQVPMQKLPEIMCLFEKEAAVKLKETGAAHVLYAAKIFDGSWNLTAVQFYMSPMSDRDFKRGPARVNRAIIYALHRR